MFDVSFRLPPLSWSIKIQGTHEGIPTRDSLQIKFKQQQRVIPAAFVLRLFPLCSNVSCVFSFLVWCSSSHDSLLHFLLLALSLSLVEFPGLEPLVQNTP